MLENRDVIKGILSKPLMEIKKDLYPPTLPVFL